MKCVTWYTTDIFQIHESISKYTLESDTMSDVLLDFQAINLMTWDKGRGRFDEYDHRDVTEDLSATRQSITQLAQAAQIDLLLLELHDLLLDA